jgi:FkbH-like protein
MLDLYKKLSWLPEIPEEDLLNLDNNLKQSNFSFLKNLSKYRLGDHEIKKVHTTFNELKNKTKEEHIIRVLIISNNTYDFIVPHLTTAALRKNLLIEFTLLPYGDVFSQLIDKISDNELQLYDYVLLALDKNGIYLKDDFSKQNIVDNSINEIERIRKVINDNSKAILIFQSILSSSEELFGNMDKYIPGTENQILSELNTEIQKHSMEKSGLFFNLKNLVHKIGIANWNDPRMYHLAKLPFSSQFNGIYSNALIHLIIAEKGLSKKALILDLDNTLWGGVIGDDGLDGIKAYIGDPIGESYLSFQSYCKRLKERGVILAVCSKNNKSNALLPFKKNQDMSLKESDFAVFKANWNNKVDNIKEISKELNIGLDSLVFIDDNPIERHLVREYLPEVEVLEISNDVSTYPEIISVSGCFETIRFSDDDLKRSDDYLSNKERKTLESESTDISDYLKSLKMESQINEVEIKNLTRPLQLTLKTNQFNITNKRRSEKDFKKILSDPNYTVLQFRLKDKFGDNGIVSVIILENKKTYLDIDTWVMSCRVFSRTLEFFIFDKIVECAKELNLKKISGEYFETEKNVLVREIYKNFGFEKAEENKYSSKWELIIEKYKKHNSFIKPLNN